MIDKKNPAPLKRDDVRLAWVDLEMSGLDPDADVILEAAFIVTDADLNIVAESPSWAVRPPPGALDNMDKWNTKTHAKSGLAERCRAAEMDNDEVQREALKFFAQARRARPLADVRKQRLPGPALYGAADAEVGVVLSTTATWTCPR